MVKLSINRVKIITTLWAMGIFAVVQYPFLTEPDRVDGDVLQHAYWMLEWRTDLSDDLLAQYSISSNPPAVRALYSVVRRVMNPVLFTKLFPIVAGASSAYLVADMASAMGGAGAALMCGLIFPLHIGQKEFFWYGVANAGDIGPWLLILIMWAMMGRRFVTTAWTLLLQALFYPPLFLLSAGAVLLLFFGQILRDSWNNRWLPPFAASAMGFWYLLAAYGGEGTFGPRAQGAMIRSMPEFGEHGRTPLVYDGRLANFLNCRSGICINRATVCLSVLAGLGLFFSPCRSRMIPSTIKAYLVSSVLLYSVARIVMLKLYEPSRFIKFDLPVILLLWSGGGLGPLLRRGQPRLKVAVVGSVLFLIMSAYHDSIGHLGVKAGNDGLLAAIRGLPTESVIVGHPLHLDIIPLFAQRRILISHELAMPYAPNYYLRVKERTLSFFEAYFSDDQEKLRSYLAQCGASHLLIFESHFAKRYAIDGEPMINPRYGRFYFEPFEKIIADLVTNGNSSVLGSAIIPGVIYSDDEYKLVDIKAFLAKTQPTGNPSD